MEPFFSRASFSRIATVAGGGALLAAVAAYSLLVAIGTQPGVNLDDAFITLIYARNLAESGDFFYNLADGPVDGFSSLLDVLLKAVGIWLVPSSPIAVSLAASLVYHLFALGAGALVIARVTRGAPGRWRLPLATCGILVLTCSPDLAESTATGLEAPLFVALGLYAIHLVFDSTMPRPGRHVLLAVAVGSLPLARPEGLVLTAALVAAYLVACRRTPAARTSRIVAVSIGLALMGYYLWRICKFGYWAPNSYYAKTSTSRLMEIADGWSYLLAYGEHRPVNLLKIACFLLVPAALALGDRWGDPTERRHLALTGLAALLVGAAVVLAGGDCYRLSARLLALPAVLAALLPLQVAARWKSRALTVGAVTMLVTIALAHLAWSLPRAARAPRRWLEMENVLRCLRGASQGITTSLPGVRIAQSDFQMIKFFAPGHHVVDLHGLNNRRIAHQPVDGHVVFGKFSQAGGLRANAPVYIYGVKRFTRLPMARLTLRQILAEPALYKKYVGYPQHRGVPDREILTPRQARALREIYLPASLRVPDCDPYYFNFLLQQKVAHRLRDRHLLVGGE